MYTHNHMKRIPLVFFFFCIIPGASAQYVTIPDAYFVSWLTNHYPQCMNGSQLDTTCAAIVNEDSVDCSYSNIQDLDGIQYFDHLNYLSCWYNYNLSWPALPASLKYLNCSRCHLGNLLNLPNGLTHLVITDNNFNILWQFPDSLQYLDCRYSSIDDIFGLPASLTYLDCSYNSIDSLTPIPDSLVFLNCSFNGRLRLSTLPSALLYFSCSTDSLDSIPPLPANLYSLDCSSNMNLPLSLSLPASLKRLNCSKTNLTNTIILPPNLEHLYCINNGWTALPSLPNALTHLDCSTNRLHALPGLPSGLSFLKCMSDSLMGFSSFPNLDTLYCGGNFLGNIPILPGRLRYLDCVGAGVTGFADLSDSLTYLNCNNNDLTSLPAIPGGLKTLSARNNHLLTALPPLPSSLITLDCSYDSIGVIPILPNGLVSLVCTSNELDSLPLLPGSLKILGCGFNRISSLPALPPNLQHLECFMNQLTALPPLPDSLLVLSCEYNAISNIPDLPDSLFQLFITDNPINCLPRIKKIEILHFTNTNVHCIPNYGSVGFSSPSLSTLPLCDGINSVGCDPQWNIRGKVYLDGNTNCQYDITDSVRRNVKIRLLRNGSLIETVFSDNNGNYDLKADSAGLYTISIDTAGLPFIVSCPANGLYSVVVTSVDSPSSTNNFALACKPGFDLAAFSTAGIFRPARTTRLSINAGDCSSFYGLNCSAGISGTVKLIVEGPVHYFSPAVGALTPSIATADSIVWSVNDFGAIDFFNAFNIIMETDTYAHSFDNVCFSLSVSPVFGDQNPNNNDLHYCTAVFNSFDPNDKAVYPAGNVDTSQKWLTYTIRFQNTGNAEAFNIYVMDTLNSNIDPSTFQLLGYSHQPQILIKQSVVRFSFPNINLPDSNSNEPGSHGYVQFKVKLHDNLPLGTTVANTAYIYFDFNDPVVTNTTSSTVAINTSIKESRTEQMDVLLFPNPGRNNLVIETAALGPVEINIYSITGFRIMSVKDATQKTQISTIGWAPGIYLAEIKGKETTVTKRWVKM